MRSVSWVSTCSGTWNSRLSKATKFSETSLHSTGNWIHNHFCTVYLNRIFFSGNGMKKKSKPHIKKICSHQPEHGMRHMGSLTATAKEDHMVLTPSSWKWPLSKLEGHNERHILYFGSTWKSWEYRTIIMGISSISGVVMGNMIFFWQNAERHISAFMPENEPSQQPLINWLGGFFATNPEHDQQARVICQDGNWNRQLTI